jgi:hypothetical protein
MPHEENRIVLYQLTLGRFEIGDFHKRERRVLSRLIFGSRRFRGFLDFPLLVLV